MKCGDIMNKFSLSVIIPNYNKDKYLNKCIDSIINQTLLPNEIIIVDDCSTDNSKKIIKKYMKKYKFIKGIFLKKNSGVSNARNIGLKEAKSNYVSFTDSDDFYYTNDKLKNEMNLIKMWENEGEDIVAYSAIVLVDKDNQLIKLPKLNKNSFMEKNIKFSLLIGNKFDNIPRDYCIKKNILLKVGAYNFYDNYYEDFDLLMRLSEKIKFYSTYDYGIAYRQTGNGLSNRKKSEAKKRVNEITNNYMKDYSLLERICIRIIGFFVYIKILFKTVLRKICKFYNK